MMACLRIRKHISSHMNRENCGCKADLLFQPDHSEVHNRVITAAREEEHQNLVFPEKDG